MKISGGRKELIVAFHSVSTSFFLYIISVLPDPLFFSSFFFFCFGLLRDLQVLTQAWRPDVPCWRPCHWCWQRCFSLQPPQLRLLQVNTKKERKIKKERKREEEMMEKKTRPFSLSPVPVLLSPSSSSSSSPFSFLLSFFLSFFFLSFFVFANP